MSLQVQRPNDVHGALTSPGAHAAAQPAPARSRGRPRKTPAERDDGNRRQDLIGAAAKLFRHQGFAATSTRDIASAVGMRSGSPFYHFESKEALLAEVMEQGMRAAIERQNAVMAPSVPSDTDAQSLSKIEQTIAAGTGHMTDLSVFFVKKLEKLVRGHFEVLLGTHSDFIPVMLYEWRSLNATQRARIAQLQSEYELLWTPVFDALHALGHLRGELKLAKMLFFGALNWSVQWYSPRGTASLDALTQSVLDTFLQSPHGRIPVPASAPACAYTPVP